MIYYSLTFNRITWSNLRIDRNHNLSNQKASKDPERDKFYFSFFASSYLYRRTFFNKAANVMETVGTVCFRDFCQWWFDFKLEPIFDTAPSASKNKARFKSGQSWLKNNHLVTLDLNPWNSLRKVNRFTVFLHIKVHIYSSEI